MYNYSYYVTFYNTVLMLIIKNKDYFNYYSAFGDYRSL